MTYFEMLPVAEQELNSQLLGLVEQDTPIINEIIEYLDRKEFPPEDLLLKQRALHEEMQGVVDQILVLMNTRLD